MISAIVSGSEPGSLSPACAPQAGEEAYCLSFKKPTAHIGKQDLNREENKKMYKIDITCQRNSGARGITVDGHRRLVEVGTGTEPNRMQTI